MSYYQQQNRHRLSIGQDGNALVMLIAINLIVFVILAFIKVVYYFSEGGKGLEAFNNGFLNWVTLPADLDKFKARPWTLFSYMFVHDTTRVWHIVGNMLWLWAFGYILQDLTGNRKLIPVFIYGALAGAFAYMLAFNVVNPLRELMPNAEMMGASAGIMAIAIAATTLAPNYRIFTMLNGGIPIWVVTVIYLILDLAMIPEGNHGGHIAHIAGGAMGFFFMVMLQRGRDMSLWMNNVYDWANDLFNPEKPKKGKVVKSQLFYKAKVQPFTKTPLVTQQRIDEILDKINQKGYNSLSEDEKEMLKRASKEDLT
ncbi:MAG TPA: rhomboid family intramembrane serine protease [Flavisolibacter sp.]|nr:rhomboid family intramembrane serine protease [Flavisolibacter sp.]